MPIVIVSALLLMAFLYWFVERTRTGRAMRAVSEDTDTAALMGIDVDRIIVTTFAIGGLLAGAAGVLYALVYNQVIWSMGFLPGIKAFTAAVLGGIGNIIGAMLGGVVLGVLESVAPALLLQGLGVPSPNQLRDVIAFSVLVLVLIFRPYGLLRPPGEEVMPVLMHLRRSVSAGLVGGRCHALPGRRWALSRPSPSGSSSPDTSLSDASCWSFRPWRSATWSPSARASRSAGDLSDHRRSGWGASRRWPSCCRQRPRRIRQVLSRI